jgi:hypothetical protein
MISKSKRGIEAGIKATTKANTLFSAFGMKGPEKEIQENKIERKVDLFGDGVWSKNRILITS